MTLNGADAGRDGERPRSRRRVERLVGIVLEADRAPVFDLGNDFDPLVPVPVGGREIDPSHRQERLVVAAAALAASPHRI